MKHIDYGLGVFRSMVFESLSKDKYCDLSDIYKDLSTHAELAGYEVIRRFYEIGSGKGLEETTKYLEGLKNREDLCRSFSNIKLTYLQR